MASSLQAFGSVVFDPASMVLRRDGVEIRLSQRAATLLDALIHANHAVVTKANLMERAWPGLAIEEGNLTVQIAALRKAMGVQTDGQDWIVTVPRVGYRLHAGANSKAIADAVKVDLPIIAVLAFDNLGGDPEQDYLADGIVDDIVTALSRFKSLQVIARNSSFVYKGRAVDLRRVADELGANYILEGSVRRSGDRLRISAQLIYGLSGANLWAENFDVDSESVFDVQDQITTSVAAIVVPKIHRAEINRSRQERPNSIVAYDLFLRAEAEMATAQPDANERARALLERSIAIDPGYAPALMATAIAYMMRFLNQFPGVSDADAERSLVLSRKALSLGRDDANLLAHAGFIAARIGREYDIGIALLRRAMAENPGDAPVMSKAGIVMLLCGDLDEAEYLIQQSMKLNPGDFETHWQLTSMAHVCLASGKYERALEWATRSQAVDAGYDVNHMILIAANEYLGRRSEAHRYLAALVKISPGVTPSRIRRVHHSRDPHRIDVLIEGMRRAGMPEG